ncbi:MAG: hypothetical protein EBU96_04215 [Actinobacteria bacterium]|nr:hypothetical protein [Actinomycetota bacterium]
MNIFVTSNQLKEKEGLKFLGHLNSGQNTGFYYLSAHSKENLAYENEAVLIEDSNLSQEDLRRELPSAREISANTAKRISDKYPGNLELKALRTNDAEYKAFIEQVVAEHNAAKDALFSL